MKTSIVSAFALAVLLAFHVNAQDVPVLLTPEQNAKTDNCPYFSWKAFTQSSGSYYLTVKRGSTTLFNRKAVSTLFLPNNTYTLAYGNQFPNGEYTWFIERGSYKSAVQTFSVVTQTCLPASATNKIDNTFSSNYRCDGKSIDNVTPMPTAWQTVEQEKFSSGDPNNPYFVYPPPGGKIFEIKIRETWNETSHYQYEPAYANLSLDVAKVSEGDKPGIFGERMEYIIAFWYMFYSETESRIYVSLIGGDDPDTPVVCFGGDADSHNCLWTGNNHITPDMTYGKWTFFHTKVSLAMEKQTYKLRFDYVRNKVDHTNPEELAASSMFFMRSVVVGQCAAFVNDEYSFGGWSTENPCARCDTANMSIPVDFKSRCKPCSSEQDSEVCDAYSYCVGCEEHQAPCEDVHDSTCKADSGCTVKAKTACNGDCRWCSVDEKCVFKDDVSSCSRCDSLNKSVCEDKTGECSWCHVSRSCMKKTDICPGCESINEPSACALEFTDGACQYCHSTTACQPYTETCYAQCDQKKDVATCVANQDCHWCESTELCEEARLAGECDNCIDLGKSACENMKGCHWSEIGVCYPVSVTDLPTCSSLFSSNCSGADGKTFNCFFCNSTQKCLTKGSENDCAICSKLSEKDCNKAEYIGCSFCKSDKVCQNKDEACQECAGMSSSVCLRHPKGCCFSSDKNCYDIDSGNCGSTISLEVIIGICVGIFVVVLAAILIPVLICCCKKKDNEGIEMNAPGTIVVLPEGQPSMVVAPESMASVTLDPAVSESIDAAGGVAPAASAQVNSAAQMSDMQNMMVQQQLLNTMMAQQQMSMMMNPMMVNSMMGMGGMSGMGMGGMNTSMGMTNMGNTMSGMDMNSMAMTGGMNMGSQMNPNASAGGQ